MFSTYTLQTKKKNFFQMCVSVIAKAKFIFQLQFARKAALYTFRGATSNFKA